MFVGKVGPTTMSTSKPTSLTKQTEIQQHDERVLWFYSWIRKMMSKKLNQNMEQVYIHNMDAITDLAKQSGVIIAPNHVSYWDSCLYFVLSHQLSNRAFVFVAKETLQRLPFLRWCGALPINTRSKREAIQQLIAAQSLHTSPSQFWIFPQGEHRPPHLNPLEFKKGVSVLAQHLHLPIVPVSIDYLYKDSEQPIAYISFRSPLPHSSTIEEIEHEIALGLQDIQACHLREDALDFRPFYTPRAKSDDGLPTKILAWFAGKLLRKI